MEIPTDSPCAICDNKAAHEDFIEAIASAIDRKLDTRFELLGLAALGPDARAEIRKDFEFTRSLRTRTESAIGAAVKWIAIMALAGFLAFAGWGFAIKTAAQK